MQAIKDNKSLAGAIRLLESRKVMQADDIRIHWEKTKEELNPGNLLKEGFRETISSPDFQGQLVKGALSLATGFITKKLFVGGSHNGIKQVLGTLLQTGATGLTYKNSDSIKTKGASLLSGFLKKLRLGD